MVVKRVVRRGRKKRDEKYTEPSRVDEWTFINAVTVAGGVRGERDCVVRGLILFTCQKASVLVAVRPRVVEG